MLSLPRTPRERCHLSIPHLTESNLKQKSTPGPGGSTRRHSRGRGDPRRTLSPAFFGNYRAVGKEPEQSKILRATVWVSSLFCFPQTPGSLRLGGARRAGWTDRRSPPPGLGSLSLPGDPTREAGGDPRRPACGAAGRREGGRRRRGDSP